MPSTKHKKYRKEVQSYLSNLSGEEREMVFSVLQSGNYSPEFKNLFLGKIKFRSPRIKNDEEDDGESQYRDNSSGAQERTPQYDEDDEDRFEDAQEELEDIEKAKPSKPRGKNSFQSYEKDFNAKANYDNTIMIDGKSYTIFELLDNYKRYMEQKSKDESSVEDEKPKKKGSYSAEDEQQRGRGKSKSKNRKQKGKDASSGKEDYITI